MPKVQKKGQIGHFWYVHLQSTIKHSCVIIIYTHSTLFLFFPLDYKHVKSEQAKCDFSSGSFFRIWAEVGKMSTEIGISPLAALN